MGLPEPLVDPGAEGLDEDRVVHLGWTLTWQMQWFTVRARPDIRIGGL